MALPLKVVCKKCCKLQTVNCKLRCCRYVAIAVSGGDGVVIALVVWAKY